MSLTAKSPRMLSFDKTNVPDIIHHNVEQLMVLCKEYETQVPFEQFSDKPYREVIKNVDNKIKSILEKIINKSIDLDVAFIQIHTLIIYATSKMDKLYPNISENNCMGYYKFLIHFVIFGCCLGKKYTDYMMLNNKDDDYKKSVILRYFVTDFLPKVGRTHRKYKQCKQARDVITNILKEYIPTDDVRELIADFVEFDFDEFFMTLTLFFTHFDETYQKLWINYGFEPDRSATDFIPRLLYKNEFIQIYNNDKLEDSLKFFADIVFDKSYSITHGQAKKMKTFWSNFLALASNPYCWAIWIVLILIQFGFFFNFAMKASNKYKEEF